MNHNEKNFSGGVFDQSLFTALTNAEFLYQWWVECTLLQVGEVFGSIAVLRRDDDAVQEGSAVWVTRLQLKAVQRVSVVSRTN